MTDRKETEARAWMPGMRVLLEAPDVTVRSVTERDLDGDLASWMGSQAWTKHVFKPDIAARDYMAGVVRFCDQKSRFVFQIQVGDPRRPVGYRKVQLYQEAGTLAAIQTSIIAEAHAGHGYSTRAAALIDWFLATYLDVKLMAPRVYEENTAAQEKLLHVGYTHVRTVNETVTEPQGSGRTRAVRVYHLPLAPWLTTLGDRIKDFRVSALEP